VNFFWNFCNETQTKAAKAGRKRLDVADLDRLTKGATKAGLDLLAQTVHKICEQYDTSRQQHRKPWLNWRRTRGIRRSLGWIAFNQQALKFRDGAFIFRGQRYDVWLHRPLPDNAKIGCGSFSEDLVHQRAGRGSASDTSHQYEGRHRPRHQNVGEAVQRREDRHACVLLRASEAKLATLQRARKSTRVKAIHAKIPNRRKDFVHKETTKLVRQYGFIALGNVSPSKLARTNMARGFSMPVGRISGPC
jgi:putative transposase